MLKTKSAILLFSGLFISSLAFADPITTQVGTAVGNFHMVDASRVYRGARPGDSGIEALAKAGIRTVIDLQGGDRIFGIPTEAGESDADINEEANVVTQNGMRFVSMPLSAITPDQDDQEDSVNVVLTLVSDPKNQPVFFHCFHGEDRTGLIAALYRVFNQGCTPSQAHQEMLDDGHSSLLPWMDNFFQDLVSSDPRTHQDTPAPTCPLN